MDMRMEEAQREARARRLGHTAGAGQWHGPNSGSARLGVYQLPGWGGARERGKGEALVGTRRFRVVRLILGIVLFGLVIGIWACLWIPPLP